MDKKAYFDSTGLMELFENPLFQQANKAIQQRLEDEDREPTLAVEKKDDVWEASLYDPIDQYYGIHEQHFKQLFQKAGTDDIILYINCPGGSAHIAQTIRAMMARYKGKITTHVDGIAASASSLVAIQGDRRTMHPDAQIMVHRTHVFAMGNADDLKSTVAQLEKADEAQVRLFSEQTGSSKQKIEEMLKAETFMSAQEAKDLGFVQSITDMKQMANTNIRQELDNFLKLNSLIDSMKDAA